tara:strand:- start:77 stop:406 length:330 start_codon:yes stop_codon:yes gene_type:complete
MTSHTFKKHKDESRFGLLPKKDIWLIPEFRYRTLEFSTDTVRIDYELVVSDDDVYEMQTLKEIEDKKPLVKIRDGENIPFPTDEQITELHRQLKERGIEEENPNLEEVE